MTGWCTPLAHVAEIWRLSVSNSNRNQQNKRECWHSDRGVQGDKWESPSVQDIHQRWFSHLCVKKLFSLISVWIWGVLKGFWQGKDGSWQSEVREGDSWWLVDMLLDCVHAKGDRDSWGLVIMICCGIIILDSGDGAKGTAQRWQNTCREAITLFPKLHWRKQIYHSALTLSKINEL